MDRFDGEALWTPALDLEALGAAASHDLMEPLNLISLYAAVIESRGGPAEDCAKVKQATTQVADMLRELADYLRGPEACLVQVTPDDLGDLMGPSGVVEGVSGPMFGPVVRERVVGGLLDNARRHGADPIGCGVRLMGDATRIDVWDSGEGIDPALEPRCALGPLVARPHGRPGLGLAWVRRAVAQVGGALELSQASGRFTVSVHIANGR